VYIGIQGGGAWGNYLFDYNPPDVGGRATGALFGGTIGGNWQAPGSNIVLGIEGDYAWANIRGGGPCPNPAFSCDVDLNSFGTIRGRLGVAMNTWLLYVTGGAAFGNLSASTTLPGGVVPPSGGPTHGHASGAAAGPAAWAPRWRWEATCPPSSSGSISISAPATTTSTMHSSSAPASEAMSCAVV
jgi:outer membrane immunogenic protein